MLAIIYVLATIGFVAALVTTILILLSMWYNIKITIGKDKGDDGKA